LTLFRAGARVPASKKGGFRFLFAIASTHPESIAFVDAAVAKRDTFYSYN